MNLPESNRSKKVGDLISDLPKGVDTKATVEIWYRRDWVSQGT